MEFAPAGGLGGRDTPCWGVRAGGRSTKNIYLDISHMPNYSFLAPIEVEIGICPSWGTEMWGSVFPLLGGLGIDLKYGGQLGSSY